MSNRYFIERYMVRWQQSCRPDQEFTELDFTVATMKCILIADRTGVSIETAIEMLYRYTPSPTEYIGATKKGPGFYKTQSEYHGTAI